MMTIHHLINQAKRKKQCVYGNTGQRDMRWQHQKNLQTERRVSATLGPNDFTDSINRSYIQNRKTPTG